MIWQEVMNYRKTRLCGVITDNEVILLDLSGMFTKWPKLAMMATWTYTDLAVNGTQCNRLYYEITKKFQQQNVIPVNIKPMPFRSESLLSKLS